MNSSSCCRNNHWRGCVLALLLATQALVSSAAQAQATQVLRVVPAVPRAQQPVYAQIDLGVCAGAGNVHYENGTIMVELVSFLCGTPPPGQVTNTVSLGNLPQGNYRLVAFRRNGDERVVVAETRFDVAPPEPRAFLDDIYPTINFSGWWHNPQRAGEGWFVEHHFRDRLMIGWVTYRADGSSEWYVMQSTRRQSNKLIGLLVRAEGTPPNIRLSLVGEAAFEATSDNRAQFVVRRDGQPEQSIELQRLPF